MNTERIAEIRERLADTTDGPWEVRDRSGGSPEIWGNVSIQRDATSRKLEEATPTPIYHPRGDTGAGSPVAHITCPTCLAYDHWLQFPKEEWKTQNLANAHLMAAAREDIPWLLTRLEDAREVIDGFANQSQTPETYDELLNAARRWLKGEG